MKAFLQVTFLNGYDIGIKKDRNGEGLIEFVKKIYLLNPYKWLNLVANSCYKSFKLGG